MNEVSDLQIATKDQLVDYDCVLLHLSWVSGSMTLSLNIGLQPLHELLVLLRVIFEVGIVIGP